MKCSSRSGGCNKKRKVKSGRFLIRQQPALNFYLCHESLLALMTILAQSLFALVSSHFVALLFLSVRHGVCI